MYEVHEHDVYSLSIIWVLVVAALIIALFKLIRTLLPYTGIESENRETIKRYLPIAELASWALFLIWSIQFLFSRGFLLSIIPVLVFIIIVLYLAWYGLKDIMAGILFKAGSYFQINDYVDVAGISGKVLALKQRVIEIEDSAGRTVVIPYSQVTGKIFLKHYPSHSVLSHSFLLRVPASNITDGLISFIQKMHITILTLPWASHKKEPRIHIEQENQQEVIFNITIYSLDEKYFAMTERFLEKHFTQSKID
jgi:small-conductance mechanosensitive channel